MKLNSVNFPQRHGAVGVDTSTAVGKVLTVKAGVGQYRGKVSKCEQLGNKYAVWLTCGEYTYGPFLIKELPQ